MATQSGVFLDIPPNKILIPNLEKYGREVQAQILKLGSFMARRMASYMRKHADWQDQTGAARASLRAFAVRVAASIVIYLVIGVDYGVHLILGTSRMEPHPIIQQAMQAFHAEIMQAYRSLVGA